MINIKYPYFSAAQHNKKGQIVIDRIRAVDKIRLVKKTGIIDKKKQLRYSTFHRLILTIDTNSVSFV
jgi:hypothetical protein